MKKDWDELASEYDGNTTTIIADVDCTAAGKPLCDSNDVKGFPTIKYGDPNSLQDYTGGRGLEELKTFAADNLGPRCSPENLELCTEDTRSKLEEYMAMAEEELQNTLDALDSKLKEAHDTFNTEVEILQAKYNELNQDKEATLKSIKDGGLKHAKSAKGHRTPTVSAGGSFFDVVPKATIPFLLMGFAMILVWFCFLRGAPDEPAITKSQKAKLLKKEKKLASKKTK